MRELTVDAVIRLTCSALERTCFMMAQPSFDGDASTPLPTATKFVTIAYSGPENGTVVLASSEGFARSLAASLVGESPESLDPSAADDALRELSNIVAGSLISELGGARCPFALGLPASHSTLPPVVGAAAAAVLDAESERLEVYWLREARSLAA